MNSIFGVLSRTNKDILGDVEEVMLSTLHYWGANTQKEWKDTKAYFGQLSLIQENENNLICKKSDWLIIADAVLFNTIELKKKLGIPVEKTISDSQLILEAYLRWDKECPKHLNGEFAFVIYNTESKTCFAARDHHGIKPLYYSLDENYFVFATEMKGILSLPYVSKAIDEQYIGDFICRIWLDNAHTLYKYIKRFPPAHCGTIDQNGLHLNPYWNLTDIKPLHFKKESDYIDAFDEKLIRAIQLRAAQENGIGSELSGGLDSSLVTAILKKETTKVISTYSYVLPEQLEGKGLYSDREKIIEIANYLGIEDIELITDEDKGLLESFAWNCKVHDEPPFDFNPLFRDGLYQSIYQKGQKLLFSGFGGDEMLSSQASGYLKQLYLEEKKDLVKQELNALSKRKGKSPLLLSSSLKLKLYLGDQRIHQIAKRFRSKSNIEKKLPNRPIQHALYKQLNIEERFAEYQNRYSRIGDFNTDQIRRMKEPHVSLRLEYQAQAARSFQIQYRYPLLDVNLIEFYLGLPTELKARHGNGRHIFKKVMERHLPKSMVWKESKKASSNPQILCRTNIDGKKVEEQLFSIPNNHPLWNYLDKNKLKRNRQEFKNWNQSTTDFVYLMLANKLEQL